MAHAPAGSYAGLYGAPLLAPAATASPEAQPPSARPWTPKIPAATHPLDFAAIRTWLTCAEKARLDVTTAPGDRDADPDAVTERIASGGANAAARLAKAAALAERHTWTTAVIDRELAGWVPAVGETLAALAAGTDLVFGACLSGGRLDGSPNLLVRTRTDADGTARYVPVIIKDHRPTQGTAQPKAYPVTPLDRGGLDAGLWAARTDLAIVGKPQQLDAVQGAHYWRLLDLAGHAGEPRVGIWGRPVVIDWTRTQTETATGRARDVFTPAGAAADIIVWADLIAPDTYTHPETGARLSESAHSIHVWCEASLRRALRAERRRLTDPSVPSATRPELKGECGDCGHRTRCRAALEAADDITLLAGITPARARTHRSAGVDTRTQLASLNWDLAAAVAADGTKGAADPDAPSVTERYRHSAEAARLPDAIDTARVALDGGTYRARGTEALDIAAARFELDVDIEDDGGYVFQIGVLATTRFTRAGRPAERSRYRSHLTRQRTPDAEADTFAAFWAQVTAVAAKAKRTGADWAVYVYSAHEERTFTALAERHAGHPGVPSVTAVTELIASGHWVDLYPPARDQIIWPTGTRSLKDTAKVAGHRWRDESPSGANAMAWWRTAVDPACDPDEADALIVRLEAYNEDDVWATKRLRDWLRRHGGDAAPGAALPCVDVLGPPGS